MRAPAMCIWKNGLKIAVGNVSILFYFNSVRHPFHGRVSKPVARFSVWLSSYVKHCGAGLSFVYKGLAHLPAKAFLFPVRPHSGF